jgi:hypothetical protein
MNLVLSVHSIFIGVGIVMTISGFIIQTMGLPIFGSTRMGFINPAFL